VIDVVRWTPDTVHHVALPRREGVAGRSGALAAGSAWEQLSDAGASLHQVDMRRSPLHPSNGAALAQVHRLIARTGPDVVHGHSTIGGAVARVGRWGRPVACVYTPNGLMTSSPAVAGERLLGRGTDRIVAVSPGEAARVAALRLVPEDRVVMIRNGIDLRDSAGRGVGPALDIRARFGLAAGTPIVATVARVVAQKAPEQFVRACAAVARRRPDAHFLLVGLGPRQGRVDDEVAAGGLSGRFHQIDHLPDASAVMDQFDVFALLSRYEGGPYTPLEAMRAGVPVVLSDVVGNRDTVTDAVTGFLVPFGDAEATARAIVALLDDAPLRAATVAAASTRLRTDFDARSMGARHAALYAELASGTAAGTRRSTRRLPHPMSGHSSKRPDSSASQYNS